VIASLAVLSTDMAWSESPRNSQSKKPALKKPTVKKPKATTKKSPPPLAVSAEPASKVAATVTPVPSNPPASIKPDAQTSAIVNPALQAEAAKPAPIQPQVFHNPYMTVQQPNPWQVQVYKGAPANVNPYLAYRHAAQAGTPWNTATIQAPLFALPNWVNPFLAFQQPTLPPVNPWTPPAFQAPQITPPAWVNPYLAYRLPVAPGTPWTPPTFQMPQIPQFAAPTWVNPIQAAPLAALPTPWTPPALQAPAPVAVPVWAGNPYLAYQLAYQRTPAPTPAVQAEPEKPAAVVQAPAPQVAQALPSPSGDRIAASVATPWSTPSPALPVKPADNSAQTTSLGQVWDSLKSTLLPVMPPSDQAILPTIKTVYPTGEKPLKVLTFKCPTELVGITPIPTKALHGLVNLGMDAINSANLLPFNMQQVCQ
jgi:hypothetical protein